MPGVDGSMAENLYANMEVTPREVSDKLARGEKILFVDVREQWEYDTSHIEGSVWIPLREIPASTPRLESAGEVILFCHHGMRSMDAAAWLRSQGVTSARSMAGGIDLWATEIDPKIARY
jgi:adenylyltransferase/sulfurtransferase